MWNALTEGGPVKPPSLAGGPCAPQGNQLRNSAGQRAVPAAEVHISCMSTYIITLAIILALQNDTHVQCHQGWSSWRQDDLLAPRGDCLPWTHRLETPFPRRCLGAR